MIPNIFKLTLVGLLNVFCLYVFLLRHYQQQPRHGKHIEVLDDCYY